MAFIADYWYSSQHNIDVFGILGLIAGIVSTVMPRRNLILVGSLLCCLFYAAHFWRMGAYSAVVMDMIAMIQCLASIRFITPDRRPPWLTAAFVICLVTILGATVATWQGPTSAFAALGTVFATVARLQKQAQPMRMLYVASTLCWLGHNLLLDAPLAYLCDVFAIVGLAYSITRGLNFSILRRVFIDYLVAIGHTTKVFRN